MGQWLARFLTGEGFDLLLIDKKVQILNDLGTDLNCEISTEIEDAGNAQAVIISVGIDSFEEVVKKLTFLPEDRIVMDISSLKLVPVDMMHRYIKQARVLGTHPVFGPGARAVAGHNFVLTPTNPDEKQLADTVSEFLTARGASVRLMSPEEHDRLMAIILGLAHFISIVSASTLVDYGHLEEMESVQGITYRALVTLVESVLSEDPELYASLQMNLASLEGAQEIFIKNARMWTEIVKNKDRAAFVEKMRSLRNRFEANNPDFGRSYDNMYRLTGE